MHRVKSAMNRGRTVNRYAGEHFAEFRARAEAKLGTTRLTYCDDLDGRGLIVRKAELQADAED